MSINNQNVLVIGTGGREHAISWYIYKSKNLGKLYIANGNPGTAKLGENVSFSDFEELANLCVQKKIHLIIVGPEDPLDKGIVDFLNSDKRTEHILVVGPKKLGAQLESSKDFAKEFMTKHHIPTAKYLTVNKSNIAEGEQFLDSLHAPYVLKADGLAAGKGVLILDSIEEAKQELRSMILDNKFGEASSKVVIEEFLSGIELSTFVLTNGKQYQILPTAKDYKRIGEGDKGLNTGGMGAVSPAAFVDNEFLSKVEERIIKPTISGLEKDGIEYNGFIFIGLISVNNEPYVIEYNVRMGDPETEVVMPRIKTDALTLFNALFDNTLDQIQLDIDDRFCTTVMLVSGGYPEAYPKGFDIDISQRNNDNQIVFHAGTSMKDNKLVTSGGRVLACSALDSQLENALAKSYQMVDKIDFEGKHYRTDIGKDILNLI